MRHVACEMCRFCPSHPTLHSLQMIALTVIQSIQSFVVFNCYLLCNHWRNLISSLPQCSTNYIHYTTVQRDRSLQLRKEATAILFLIILISRDNCNITPVSSRLYKNEQYDIDRSEKSMNALTALLEGKVQESELDRVGCGQFFNSSIISRCTISFQAFVLHFVL